MQLNPASSFLSPHLSEKAVQAHQHFIEFLNKKKARVIASLSSGGAEAMGRNLAMMEFLTETGIPYHEIHGSSAGASVSAAYGRWPVVMPNAEHEYETVRTPDQVREGFLDTINYRNIFDFSFEQVKTVFQERNLAAITGLFAGRRLEQRIAEEFQHSTFGECAKDIFIYAEKEGELEYETFSRETHPDLPLHEAIRASISIPYVYEPKDMDGKNYVDGGLLVHTPLRVIYQRHQKHYKDRPLVIFACTNLYPFFEMDKGENLWQMIKNRYFYKILSRIFSMELAELLNRPNVYIFLMYPEMRPIKSFSFHKMGEYLDQNKPAFYRLYERYLSRTNLNRKRSRLKFSPGYRFLNRLL